MIHFAAEIVGGDIEIVVHMRGRSGLRLYIVYLRRVVYPFIEYGEVLAHDAFVALKELIAAREGNGAYRLVEHAAAYKARGNFL